ncbi:tripartite motif-containing protein 2-like [Pecten maximus]|uniref:tripartite motif-containing protein 2-like n=1 Tax=Pecten maximus TaxID=6579 RepID=UPI001458CDFE|nr:tripartite motif-containing protein 2-like [Pecten maximus]XP_033725058.1 tripartite motif-containing protein 2-like [Pecten maximus]
MAVGGPNPNFIGDLCEETKECLSCRVCRDTLKDPRILECGHTFCLVCIQRVYMEYPEGVNSALCPLCKTRFFPKGKNAGNFPKNYVVMDCLSMLEKYDQEEKEEIPEDEICEMCDDAETVAATTYCVECCRYLCQKCEKKHRRLHAEHVSVNLNEIRDTKLYDLLRSHKEDEDCPDHPGSRMTRFCVPCKKPVCEQCCQLPSHQRHRTSPVSSTVESVQRDISRLINDVEKVSKELEKCRAYWSRLHEKLEDSHESMRNKAIKRAQELRVMIDNKKDSTLRQIETCYTEKNADIKVHLDQLEVDISNHKNLLEMARAVQTVGSACQKFKELKSLQEQLAQSRPEIHWPSTFYRHSIHFSPYRYGKLTDRQGIGDVNSKYDSFLFYNYWTLKKITVETIIPV